MTRAEGSKHLSLGIEKWRAMSGRGLLKVTVEEEPSGAGAESPVLVTEPGLAELEEEPSRSRSPGLLTRAPWIRAADCVSPRCSYYLSGWDLPRAPTMKDIKICKIRTTMRSLLLLYWIAVQNVKPTATVKMLIEKHKRIAFFLVHNMAVEEVVLSPIVEGDIVVEIEVECCMQ